MGRGSSYPVIDYSPTVVVCVNLKLILVRYYIWMIYFFNKGHPLLFAKDYKIQSVLALIIALGGIFFTLGSFPNPLIEINSHTPFPLRKIVVLASSLSAASGLMDLYLCGKGYRRQKAIEGRWPALPPLKRSYCVKKEGVVYPTSNEGSPMEAFRVQKKIEANTWVGVSGLFNLNAAYQRKLENILIIDFSPKAPAFWRQIQAIVARCPQVADARRAVYDLINQERYHYFSCERDYLLCLKQFSQEMEEGSSWLSSQESYSYIGHIFSQGQFYIQQRDLTKLQDAQEVRAFLDERNLVVDFLYVSNAGGWVFSRAPEKLQDYLSAIGIISGKDEPWIFYSHMQWNRLHIGYSQNLIEHTDYFKQEARKFPKDLRYQKLLKAL